MVSDIIGIYTFFKILTIPFNRYTLDDGNVVEVTFVADENGYRAESPVIPVAPPHVAELLRIAEEQRASGIQFDEQGRRL